MQICLLTLFYSPVHAMKPNNNPPVNQQIQTTLNQNQNQRIIDNSIATKQQIPPQLISQMHPGIAIQAYQHNTNVAGPFQKK